MEKAVLSFENKRTPTLKLFPAEGEPIVPELEQGDGYSRQIGHFVRAICGVPVPSVITPQHALQSLRIAEAERESARNGTHVNLT